MLHATIEQSAFLKALGHVQNVVERRNTIPILSNVLLQTEGGTLALAATDLDIEISERVPADVMSEGAVTASALTLFEIVKRLPDGAQIMLQLDPENARLRLLAGKSEFSLAVLPDRDFPTLSADAGDVIFHMPAVHLQQLIDKTRFAISQEETRYYLNGIYLHAATKETQPVLRAVATDGHRLALADVDLPEEAKDIQGVIVPRKTVQELRRLLDDADDVVQVSVSQSKIRFAFAEVALTSKLIDGTFPDYARVIPADNDKTLKVDNRDFTKAVDRVSTISADKTKSVKLVLASDNLTLIVNNPETGRAEEQLAVDYAYEALEIGFNAKYLMEVTAQIDGDTALLQLANAASPTIITDQDNTSALYVLMPLRV